MSFSTWRASEEEEFLVGTLADEEEAERIRRRLSLRPSLSRSNINTFSRRIDDDDADEECEAHGQGKKIFELQSPDKGFEDLANALDMRESVGKYMRDRRMRPSHDRLVNPLDMRTTRESIGEKDAIAGSGRLRMSQDR